MEVLKANIYELYGYSKSTDELIDSILNNIEWFGKYYLYKESTVHVFARNEHSLSSYIITTLAGSLCKSMSGRLESEIQDIVLINRVGDLYDLYSCSILLDNEGLQYVDEHYMADVLLHMWH